MRIIDLGVLEFKKAERIQKACHLRRVRGEVCDTVLFVIHPPVITLGRNGKMENLHCDLKKLASLGISFYRTERGGDITYHGYGQLLIYPVFFIEKGLGGIRKFIQRWEDLIIDTLLAFGIYGEREKNFPGIFVQGKKICSIGFALKERTTYHGLALNVKDDLLPFSFISPCGRKDIEMTAMERVCGRSLSISEVRDKIISALPHFFHGRITY